MLNGKILIPGDRIDIVLRFWECKMLNGKILIPGDRIDIVLRFWASR